MVLYNIKLFQNRPTSPLGQLSKIRRQRAVVYQFVKKERKLTVEEHYDRNMKFKIERLLNM